MHIAIYIFYYWHLFWIFSEVSRMISRSGVCDLNFRFNAG